VDVQRDAPGPLVDELPARPAVGSARRRAYGAQQSNQARVREPLLEQCPQPVDPVRGLRVGLEGGAEALGAETGRAEQVVEVEGLSLCVGVRGALCKAQLTGSDGPAAAAAFGASALGGADGVRHARLLQRRSAARANNGWGGRPDEAGSGVKASSRRTWRRRLR